MVEDRTLGPFPTIKQRQGQSQWRRPGQKPLFQAHLPSVLHQQRNGGGLASGRGTHVQHSLPRLRGQHVGHRETGQVLQHGLAAQHVCRGGAPEGGARGGGLKEEGGRRCHQLGAGRRGQLILLIGEPGPGPWVVSSAPGHSGVHLAGAVQAARQRADAARCTGHEH